MNINVKKLLELVETFGFKSTDTHWKLPGATNQVKIRELVRSYINSSGHAFQIRRKMSCPYKNCICPNCFELKWVEAKSAFYDEEDFLAAVEEVDYYECMRLGMKKYLAKYNSDKIELLQLTMTQLAEVMRYLGDRV